MLAGPVATLNSEEESDPPTYKDAFPPLPEKAACVESAQEPAGAWGNKIRPIKASVITQVGAWERSSSSPPPPPGPLQGAHCPPVPLCPQHPEGPGPLLSSAHCSSVSAPTLNPASPSTLSHQLLQQGLTTLLREAVSSSASCHTFLLAFPPSLACPWSLNSCERFLSSQQSLCWQRPVL